MTADQSATPPSTETHEKLRYEGVQAFKRGAIEEALGLFTQWASFEPASPAAQYYLGMALNAVGEWDLALACLDQAIKLEPRAHVSLIQKALALFWLQRLPEAMSALDEAISLQPDDAQSLMTRARILLAMGMPSEAEGAIAAAVRAAPNDVAVRAVAGEVLAVMGREAEAEKLYASVRALAPEYPDQVAARALVLARRGRHTQAANLSLAALAIAPDNLAVLDVAGFALTALNRFNEATRVCQAIVDQRTNSAISWCNLGFALFKELRLAEAEFALSRAIELDPSLGVAAQHYAAVLAALGRHVEAARAYERAVVLRPAQVSLKAWVRMYRAYICEWGDRDSDLAEAAVRLEAGEQAVDAFGSLALFDDPLLQKRAAEISILAECPDPPPQTQARVIVEGKIRLGYISADFRQHPVGKLMADVLKRHDRSKFELIAFATDIGPEDELRRQFRELFDEFHEIRHMADAEMADLIESRNIEIAVSLSGLTDQGRVTAMARKPAPVQVNFLGFPGTLGAPFIDYIVGDPIVTPQESEAYYAEKIVRLPSCFFPSGPRSVGTAPTRTECDLPEDGVVFCAFANGYKITPLIFSSWMRILQACPGSVLWLLDRDGMTDSLRREAQERGVDPLRLIFAKRALTEGEYLARLSLADIMLDTAPYGAHTTASDGLWVGIPVITTRGRTFASRVAASLVAAVGLSELDRSEKSDYEAYAIGLAHDPERRAAMRGHLVSTRDASALFDIDRYTHDLEAAFAEMSARWRRGEAPTSFYVPAKHV